MHKALPALLTAAVIAVPAGAVFAVSHGTTQSAAGAARTTQPAAGAARTPVTTARKTTTSTKTTTAATHTYKGTDVDMRWGTVQVTIVVKGKKITDVQATAPTERARSAYINGIAVPMLRQEVLKAQNANIDGISGATMTSEAFYTSLQAALKQAHL